MKLQSLALALALCAPLAATAKAQTVRYDRAKNFTSVQSKFVSINKNTFIIATVTYPGRSYRAPGFVHLTMVGDHDKAKWDSRARGWQGVEFLYGNHRLNAESRLYDVERDTKTKSLTETLSVQISTAAFLRMCAAKVVRFRVSGVDEGTIEGQDLADLRALASFIRARQKPAQSAKVVRRRTTFVTDTTDAA